MPLEGLHCCTGSTAPYAIMRGVNRLAHSDDTYLDVLHGQITPENRMQYGIPKSQVLSAYDGRVMMKTSKQDSSLPYTKFLATEADEKL